MISYFLKLTGKVDAKYANFILSNLEENKHKLLITDRLILQYIDEVSVNNEFKVPSESYESFQRHGCYSYIYELLKEVERVLSLALRKEFYNDEPAFPMEKDVNFSSVYTSIIDSMSLDLNDDRPSIEIEMSLKCWDCLKRLCETHDSEWTHQLSVFD